MLTQRQSDLLHYIHANTKDGVPPSYQEMADGIGCKARSNICRLMDQLVDRGFIRRIPHKQRAIEIIRMPSDETVPIMNRAEAAA